MLEDVFADLGKEQRRQRRDADAREQKASHPSWCRRRFNGIMWLTHFRTVAHAVQGHIP